MSLSGTEGTLFISLHFFAHADKEPNSRQMRSIVAREMSDFHGLGTMLQVEPVELSSIEENHSKDAIRRCMEVLNRWVQQETRKPVTWRTLITVLIELKERKLARKLEQEISSN